MLENEVNYLKSLSDDVMFSIIYKAYIDVYADNDVITKSLNLIYELKPQYYIEVIRKDNRIIVRMMHTINGGTPDLFWYDINVDGLIRIVMHSNIQVLEPIVITKAVRNHKINEFEYMLRIDASDKYFKELFKTFLES
jgi:hypothetical protein